MMTYCKAHTEHTTTLHALLLCVTPNANAYKDTRTQKKSHTQLYRHMQIPASDMPHSLVYQLIIIQRESDHSLRLCGKLGIKHAPASGKHKGLRKGQFVSFNCCLSAEWNQIMQGFYFSCFTSKQCRCDHYRSQPHAQ